MPTIDPDTRRLLVAIEESPGPDMEALPIAQARGSATMRSMLESLGAQPLEPVAVAAVSSIEVPTAGGPVAVRLYRPPAPLSAPPPLVVWMHGGGFVVGDLDSADPVARAVCAGAGAIVASVDYPLAPEHPFPAAPRACHEVARWLADHHEQIGFDPQRLAVGGDSAGGNLAAAVALLAAQRGGPPIRVQLLVYPMVDATCAQPSIRENAEGYFLTRSRVEWFWRHYLPDDSLRSDPLLSPLHATDLAGQPPAIVVTAELDPLRDEGEAYAERLRAAGVDVRLRRHDGLVHGFVVMGSLSARARAALDETIAALREALG